jgi:hypothetical protein
MVNRRITSEPPFPPKALERGSAKATTTVRWHSGRKGQGLWLGRIGCRGTKVPIKLIPALLRGMEPKKLIPMVVQGRSGIGTGWEVPAWENLNCSAAGHAHAMSHSPVHGET